MNIETLQPGQVLRPTKNITTTFARRIIKNDVTRSYVVVGRVLKDGSTSFGRWTGYTALKTWIRKHDAVLDG